MKVFKTIWRLIIPSLIRSYIYHIRTNFEIIEIRSGNLRSVRERLPVGEDGSPIPWFTYPAIEFLKQIDFSDKDIFEYGSGNSTLFWSCRAKSVTSVEHDSSWFNSILPRLSGRYNVNIVHRPGKEDYISEIHKHGGFDVIIIDGLYRLECAKTCLAALRPGGIILLDNSDVYSNSALYLRGTNLIQMDMIGLGPLIPAVWATSLFLHREYSMPSLRSVQPYCGEKGGPFD